MKKTILLAAITGLIVVAPAYAGGHAKPQPTAAEQMAEQQKADEAAMLQMQISMTQAKRQAIVAENIVLSPESAEAFWELYREFSNARAKIAEKEWKLLIRFRDNFDNLTEEQAKSLLDDHLKIDQESRLLRKRYLPRFRRILTEKQTLAYFQIENKMDAIMDYEIAQTVPLAR